MLPHETIIRLMKNDEIVKAPDFRSILKPYEDKWIALSADRKKVISSGNTLRDAEKSLGKADFKKIAFMKVPSFGKAFVPAGI